MTTTTIGMGGNLMNVAHVTEESDVARVLREVGLGPRRPTIVVIGGAGGVDAREEARLSPLFSEAIAPTAERLGAYVVDGGTDSGVIRLMGAARSAVDGTFPLIGVVADATVELDEDNSSRGDARIEPHHTHVLVVPGEEWGDEGPWIAAVAGALSNGHRSVTVLVNGGPLALADVGHSIAAGRPVLVVADSGRIAKVLAAPAAGEDRVGELARSELVTSVGGVDEPQTLAQAIEAALGGRD